jgi:hypothetical protein
LLFICKQVRTDCFRETECEVADWIGLWSGACGGMLRRLTMNLKVSKETKLWDYEFLKKFFAAMT